MKSKEFINTYKEIIEKSLKWINFKAIKSYGREFLTYMGDMKVDKGIIDIQLVGKHLDDGIDYVGFQADFLKPITYDEKGNPTENCTTLGICTATIKDNKIIESNFNELENKLQIVNNYINEQIKEELKDICDKYEFKYKELSNRKVALYAKNTDKHWQEWIKLDLQKRAIEIAGNTNNCNFWFYDTRKDMTPNKIIDFVANLNNLFRRFGTSTQIKTLIDAEDWQEIANVNDAYKDNLYNIEFHDIAFGEDNYIYFSVEYGEYSLDGLFRIYDPANGSDMNLVSINCSTEDDRNFVNAHWEEIQEKLCEIVNQREEKIEKNEEKEL